MDGRECKKHGGENAWKMIKEPTTENWREGDPGRAIHREGVKNGVRRKLEREL